MNLLLVKLIFEANKCSPSMLIHSTFNLFDIVLLGIKVSIAVSYFNFNVELELFVELCFMIHFFSNGKLVCKLTLKLHLELSIDHRNIRFVDNTLIKWTLSLFIIQYHFEAFKTNGVITRQFAWFHHEFVANRAIFVNACIFWLLSDITKLNLWRFRLLYLTKSDSRI